MIIQSEPNDSPLKAAILRLGGFHTQMSFLGCIGHVMQSTGLFEVLENIYASTTIEHMMTGKAVSRAVRGHFIVDCALYTIMFSRLVGVPALQTLDSDETSSTTKKSADLNVGDDDESNNDSGDLTAKRRFQEALTLYTGILEDKIGIDDVLHDENLTEINHLVRKEMERLSKYPTAKLWIQYLDMIDIMRRFIKAERTGNWHLHLHCVQEMLPFFAATGHKSVP